VLIVDGSQQALDLAVRVLADAGQRAWLEDPGYLGARAALRGNGVEVVPVPVDDEGLVVSEGVRRCPKPSLIYVTPSRQFPLGSVMSLGRRFELLNLATESGAWIIEDDYDSEFRYTGSPIQALQGIDTTGRVIYTGTFSKILFPSLRLGYMVVPDELRDAFFAARVITNLQVSTPPQAVLTEFIEGGHLYRHLRRMRKLYAERQQVLLDAIRDEMRDLIDVRAADAGMHLLGWLRSGLSARRVSEAAAQVGIDVNPLTNYCIEPCEREAILLGYTGVRPPILWRSVRELAVVMRGLRTHERLA
jgi:GntR family transcriptional regulator/MocR family aminotransferase